MDTLETIFSTGGAAYLIIVPILRELSAILLAIAISKDYKARYNKRNIMWGLLSLLSPVLIGIIYFIFSKVINTGEIKNTNNKKAIKSAKKITILAIIMYIVSFVLCVVSISAIIGTEFASQITDNGSLIFNNYYDINGNEYEKATDVPLFDKEGNKYVINKAPTGINWYAYFDESGNQYEFEDSYISEDGYFYYDNEHKLKHNGRIVTTDTIFYDESGNKYVPIGQYAYFTDDGKIIHKFSRYEDMAFD